MASDWRLGTGSSQKVAPRYTHGATSLIVKFSGKSPVCTARTSSSSAGESLPNSSSLSPASCGSSADSEFERMGREAASPAYKRTWLRSSHPPMRAFLEKR